MLWLLRSLTLFALILTIIRLDSAQLETIVFASNRGTNARAIFNIYTVKSDGSDLRRITTSNQLQADPVFSLDYKQIAFTSGNASLEGKRELYVMDSDGSRQRKVVENLAGSASIPAWTPSGKQILMSMQVDGNTTLLLVEIESGEVKTLGRGRMPAVSPKDSSILYTFDDDREVRSSTLWLMNFDGSNPRRFVKTGSALGSWSPDGSSVAYSTSNHEIAVCTRDGQEIRVLTRSPADHEFAAKWSRDGNRLFFVRVPRDSIADASQIKARIFSMNTDGTEVKPVTDEHGVDLLSGSSIVARLIAMAK